MTATHTLNSKCVSPRCARCSKSAHHGVSTEAGLHAEVFVERLLPPSFRLSRALFLSSAFVCYLERQAFEPACELITKINSVKFDFYRTLTTHFDTSSLQPRKLYPYVWSGFVQWICADVHASCLSAYTLSGMSFHKCSVDMYHRLETCRYKCLCRTRGGVSHHSFSSPVGRLPHSSSLVSIVTCAVSHRLRQTPAGNIALFQTVTTALLLSSYLLRRSD